MLGQCVSSLSSLLVMGQNSITLDVRQFSDATYTVVITVGDRRYTKKLIVSK